MLKINNLMIEIIITALLVLAVYAYYTLVIKPKRLMKWYADTFETVGYKVLLHPYQLTGSSIVDRYRKYGEEKGDCFYYEKTELYNYDLEILNILNYPMINILNPELMKEFYQPDKVHYYEKLSFLISNLQRSLGHGIAFSEGEEWKKKRKIMNSLFNYDFIKSTIPIMILSCNKAFEEAEKKISNQDK